MAENRQTTDTENSERDKPLACSAWVCYRRSTVRLLFDCIDPELMMKFMFNVAAMTWMMSDSRIWA